jgi:hypothetical protein
MQVLFHAYICRGGERKNRPEERPSSNFAAIFLPCILVVVAVVVVFFNRQKVILIVVWKFVLVITPSLTKKE